MNFFSFDQWLTDGGSTNLKSFALNQSYQRISWVYACVNITATTAASAPLVFYNGPLQTSENAITDPLNPVMQLFYTPKAPEIPSLRALLTRTFIQQGTIGGTYWVFKRQGGQLTEVVPKTGLIPIMSKAAEPKLLGWEETLASGQKKRYTIKQVLPILLYNPSSEYIGLSPLSAARLSVETEFNIAGWNNAFFKGGMKNPILLQAKGTLTKDQKKSIKSEISKYYSGIEGGQGAMLLQGNIEATPLKISPKDVDFVQGKKLTREEICGIYGVPPALVGIFEYSNYANTSAQRKIFWENTLLPKMETISDLIQTNILDTEFPGITCKWDTSQMLGLKNDPVEVADSAEKYFAMGYSKQQIAVILNTPELDEGYNPDTTGTATSGREEPTETPDKEDPPPPPPEDNALPHPSIFRSFNEWADDYGKLNSADTSRAHARTERALRSYIKEIVEAGYKMDLNKDRCKGLWEDTVGRSLKKAGKEGILSAVTAMKAVSDEGNFEVLADLSKYIPRDHQKTLDGHIDRYLDASLSVFDKLFGLVQSKNIEGIIEFTKNIPVIVKTLVSGIKETLKFKTYQLLGVSICGWVSRCSKHLALEGQQIDIGKSLFPGVNAKHPHSITMNLHDTIECDCTLVPVIFPSLANEG